MEYLSQRQFVLLKHISLHTLTIEQVARCNMITVGSLGVRGYIIRKHDRIQATPAGHNMIKRYHKFWTEFRKNSSGYTDRTRRVLNIRRYISIEDGKRKSA